MQAFAIEAMFIGAFATVALDIWQRILKLATGIPPSNWAMAGRWFGHMPRGRFVHEVMADAEEIPNEQALGWSLHYLIGLIYGFLYLGLIVLVFGQQPSFANGLAFGVASVVVPWFMMQPGMGLGVMGRNTPNPAMPRYLALTAHTLFGISLWGGTVVYGNLIA